MHEVPCTQSFAGMKWEVGALCDQAGKTDATPVTVIEHKSQQDATVSSMGRR